MRFEFATANRIVFGAGTLAEVAPVAAKMGRHAFVVTGRSIDRAAPLLEQLEQQGLKITTFAIAKEPTIDLALDGVQQARAAGCDLVIGFGGGSVIDGGKAIAALLTNSGDVLDYLEIIGRAQPLTEAPAPYIAIPTTAGTGAEVTRNAVLASPKHRVKVSLRSPLMLPDVAVVDPELTYSMPPTITASTGLDALTQVMEPYVSVMANPLTDTLVLEGMQRAAHALRRAYENGQDSTARESMAVASLFGGLALANAKLGTVHGFSGVMGGMYPTAPHGIICARLLPHVMEANVRALQSRQPDSPALSRYDDIGQLLTGQATATAADGVTWVQQLCRALAVPPLTEFGLTKNDIPDIVTKAEKASSTKGNPIVLTADELTAILHAEMNS
jgi:alcohol dehydrogenase class IV